MFNLIFILSRYLLFPLLACLVTISCAVYFVYIVLLCSHLFISLAHHLSFSPAFLRFKCLIFSSFFLFSDLLISLSLPVRIKTAPMCYLSSYTPSLSSL